MGEAMQSSAEASKPGIRNFWPDQDQFGSLYHPLEILDHYYLYLTDGWYTSNAILLAVLSTNTVFKH